MAITEVGTATQSTSDQTAITPTGVVSGDVLVAQVAGYNWDGAPMYVPVGWTTIQLVHHTSGGDDNITSGTYYYVCGSSTPSTFTWTYPFGTACVITTAWRGVDNATPIDTSSQNDGFSAAPTGASVTTASGNMLLWLWMGDCTFLSANPSGWTIDVDGLTARALSPLASCGSYGAYHELAPGGATGSIGSTATGADDWVVQVIALKAAGGGAVGAQASVAAIHYAA